MWAVKIKPNVILYQFRIYFEMYNFPKLPMLGNTLNKPSLFAFIIYIFSEQKG